VCRALAPILATDWSGTTRPWHPILKETDRGEVTGSSDVPFELELRRYSREVWWAPPPGGMLASPEPDEVGIRYVYG
jgi:hypothetical protein